MPENQCALIVGAGREPAASLALSLARQGFGLALNDLTPMAIDALAEKAREMGVKVSCHVADPSKGLAARMLLDEVLDTWGQIDVLVLNPRAEPRQSLLDLDEWDWQRTLESNLNAPFLMMQGVARWMRSEERGGVILNLISIGEPLPEEGSIAFRVSQMGFHALTQAAAKELSGTGIRVFGLCTGSAMAPGVVAEAARVGTGLCLGKEVVESGEIFMLKG
ncbi:MAG TPA: hypothetical protein DEQ80_12195 [Anaerolinea thermolimosa]|uniref:SDR family oxidoreductase n=1 Tax=Anaerolinea thermolimosa TaxID=229919 RepID=A0A3D1JLH1_9CHLR|nr:SDR family NAD(P)-dependent oxidoreductase [Anaerolinea thermolimosa]GAP07424.1 dehydrogenase related to short-chain alcohol dehydrogenases [Anaerolinea thermolimosa]HCE18608.1 hypothetical protein [Anaerolinea thermolimosa]